MTINRQEVIEAVEADKRRAREVRQHGKLASEAPVYEPHPVDITGRPLGVQNYVHERLDARQALGHIGQRPFFARVDVQFTGDERPKAILIARDVPSGELESDDWVVMRWETCFGR